MDLSILEADDRSFINFVESNWNISIDYKIKIVSHKLPLPSYLLKIDTIPGGRAFVLHSLKEMHLYNYGYDKTIIHEFGHVLGLRDNYYTYWDPLKCVYVDQFNPADLMSDSSQGTVLNEHWNAIKKAYWKND